MASLSYSLIATSLIFVFSVALGFFAAETLRMNLIASLRETFEPILRGLNPFQLLGLIFVNNSGKAFLALLLGLGIGILPLLFIASNGFILGVVVVEIQQVRGIEFVLAALVPHGVLELPSVLLSAAVGVRLGWEVIRKIRGNQSASLRYELSRGIRFFVYRLLPLFLIAAVIEAFVTPSVINLLG